jgi:hypothetical protein
MPLLPNSPCHERWSELTPNADGRYCGKCDKTVVDLTRLTRRQAEKLVVAAGGGLCGRLRIDPSGAPVFRPEVARAPGMLGIAAAGLLAACGSTTESESASSPVTLASAEGRDPSGTAGGDHLLGEDPSSGSLAGAMAPIGSGPESEEEAMAPAGPSVVGAILEDGADAIPTDAQRTLTEAKEEERRPARRRRRAVADAHEAVDPARGVRGRRNGPHPVTSTPGPGPVSPLNLPSPGMYMGGIRYTH